MIKKTSYLLVLGIVVLAVSGGAIALKHQSNHHATTSSRQQRPTQKKRSKTTNASSQTKSDIASKREDLRKIPTERNVTEQLKNDGKQLVSTQQVSQQASQLDFKALAQADFSSLAGTWQDANGYTFEFSPQGLIDDKLILSALTYDNNGEPISNVHTENGGGFTLHYYAAGTPIPHWHFDITASDPSDYGRDRLFATQLSRFDYESTNQFISNVFYKVSDDYSQKPQEESDKLENRVQHEEDDATTITSTTSSQVEETKEPQTESVAVD